MARGSVKPRVSTDGKRVSYRVKWESRGPDGKRRYHSATQPTKKEADKFLADKLKEVNDGSFIQPTKETLGAYLERWLNASAPSWTEATLYQYRSAVSARVAPYLGDLLLARLDELTIQAYYTTLAEAGYSAQTIMATHSLLDSALSRAVAWRILPRNPVDGVKPPAVAAVAPTAWTQDEAAGFLMQTTGDRFAILWRLGLDSGMRLGEMLAASWRDFDRDRGILGVRRTLTRTTAGGWKIGEIPKTSSSRRSIVLGSDTVAALRAHGARQAERRLACGAVWIDLGLMFDRGDGAWIDPTTVRREFQRAVKKAQVPMLTPHGMRHTMATLMLEAGVHPKIVQERLGHKTIQMTLDRYSHVTQNMQQDAAATIDAMLRGRTRPKRGHEAG